ncbi:ATP/GTP-binding protein [Corynebacterium mendelii]|uniref:AAA family ATPase n=1 Tax=Corynebacterium mendelii TaxID=2765362 RepID=A0A939IYX6_9CORY|nr:ATP-binding protein [Corynebacterium mendelii]MBN9645127.1 AAA family ATPase [Corynebacterium mendelii]
MLLAFTVTNFASFADETTLDLQQRSFTTLHPKNNDWVDVTSRIAGIFGPNASGKSNLIRPLGLITGAVAESLRDSMFVFPLRNPHVLHAESDTRFEVEYTRNKVRYRWILILDNNGVVEESLEASETSAWRVVFHRERDEITFGRSAKIPAAAARGISEMLKPWVLVFSAWGTVKTRGPYYAAVEFWQDVTTLDLGDQTPEAHQRRARYHHDLLDKLSVPEWLVLGTELLQSADTGITGVKVDEREAPPGLAEAIQKVNEIARRILDGEEVPEELLTGSETKTDTTLVARSLRFTHDAGESEFELPEAAESAGTLEWLNVIVPLLSTLATGGVAVVDELGGSLHSSLVQYAISLFLDPTINDRGAQLIFTSQVLLLLDTRSIAPIPRDGLWFVEKDKAESTLVCLDDFSVRSNHNPLHRYLSGRYAALPVPRPLSPAKIRKLRSILLNGSAEN